MTQCAAVITRSSEIRVPVHIPRSEKVAMLTRPTAFQSACSAADSIRRRSITSSAADPASAGRTTAIASANQANVLNIADL